MPFPLSRLLIYNIQASFAVIRRWKISWSNQPVITIQHWPRFTWQVVSWVGAWGWPGDEEGCEKSEMKIKKWRKKQVEQELWKKTRGLFTHSACCKYNPLPTPPLPPLLCSRVWRGPELRGQSFSPYDFTLEFIIFLYSQHSPKNLNHKHTNKSSVSSKQNCRDWIMHLLAMRSLEKSTFTRKLCIYFFIHFCIVCENIHEHVQIFLGGENRWTLPSNCNMTILSWNYSLEKNIHWNVVCVKSRAHVLLWLLGFWKMGRFSSWTSGISLSLCLYTKYSMEI